MNKFFKAMVDRLVAVLLPMLLSQLIKELENAIDADLNDDGVIGG